MPWPARLERRDPQLCRERVSVPEKRIEPKIEQRRKKERYRKGKYSVLLCSMSVSRKWGSASRSIKTDTGYSLTETNNTREARRGRWRVYRVYRRHRPVALTASPLGPPCSVPADFGPLAQERHKTRTSPHGRKMCFVNCCLDLCPPTAI